MVNGPEKKIGAKAERESKEERMHKRIQALVNRAVKKN